jgi:ketosteroid isomerase-like protein
VAKRPSRLDAPPQANTSERDDHLRRLLEANNRFYEAFEALDLEQMEGVWSQHEAVSCMHPSPGWSLLKGWDAVRRSWEQLFHRLRAIRFELSDLRVVLAGEVAWIVLTERLWAYAYDSEEEIREATITTNLFERAGDSYKLLHHHATMLVALPEEKPSTSPSTLPNDEEFDAARLKLAEEEPGGEAWGPDESQTRTRR